jgi:hypothetical protein
MLIDVTGKKREEEKPEEKYVKPAYDWRYENSINVEKEPLSLDGNLEHKYNQWRTNTSLSAHIDTLFYVNEMNIYHHLSDKLHYHYLFYSVRKAKRFGKKKTENDKKLERVLKKEQELVSLIQEHYKYNTTKARQALKILTEEQLDTIRKIEEKGG